MDLSLVATQRHQADTDRNRAMEVEGTPATTDGVVDMVEISKEDISKTGVVDKETSKEQISLEEDLETRVDSTETPSGIGEEQSNEEKHVNHVDLRLSTTELSVQLRIWSVVGAQK
jgi:hypothetical protein